MRGTAKSDGLVKALRALLRRRRSREKARAGVDVTPLCPFGAVADQRLKDLERGLVEMRGRTNALIFLLLAALAGEVAARLLA